MTKGFLAILMITSIALLPLASSFDAEASCIPMEGSPTREIPRWEMTGPASFVLRSPDGDIELGFALKRDGSGWGMPKYNLSADGKTMILDSSLGLDFTGGTPPLDDNMTLRNVVFSHHEGRYDLSFGERSEVKDVHNEAVVNLTDDLARPLQLVFRVYNEGMGFRYWLPQITGGYIDLELTEFRFDSDHFCFAQYDVEKPYSRIKLSAITNICHIPFTMEIGQDRLISICEASLDGYSRMSLAKIHGESGLSAQLGEKVYYYGSVISPWRVVLTGESPGDLYSANHIIYSLNPPCAICDTSWIRPGKVIMDTTLTTNGSKACIDFAFSNGLQYVELDAGWYGEEWSDDVDATVVSAPDLNLTEVITYGRERRIGIILYINWKNLKKQLPELLSTYESWGIKGVKFGFVDGDTQSGINFLHMAVKEAAEHRLIVDIHDKYRPTGFSRTYPNLLTQEGIMGNENHPTSEQNAIQPFTRMLAGAADYTAKFYTMNNRTTMTHQLALPVIVHSPLQFLYWYSRPEYLGSSPGIEFWGMMPTVWDETKIIDGRIGDYVITARRSGRDWFIGALNDDHMRILSIPLDFLDEGMDYEVHIYYDQNNTIGKETRRVDSTTVLIEGVSGNGGIAVRITPDLGGGAPDYRSRLNSIDDRTVEEEQFYSEEGLYIEGNGNFSLVFGTSARFLDFDPYTVSISGIPDDKDVGIHWVNISLLLDLKMVLFTNYTLTVVNVNDPPRITNKPSRIVVEEDSLLELQLVADDPDPDGDTLEWSLETDASFLKMDSATGLITGLPQNDDVGEYLLRVAVSDGNGGSDSAPFNLSVVNTNDDPLIIAPSTLPPGKEDLLYEVFFEGTDPDPVGDPLYWSFDSNAPFLKPGERAEVLSGVPRNEDVGAYYINVTLSDGAGGLDNRNLTFTVENVNDDPLLMAPAEIPVCMVGIPFLMEFSAYDCDPTEDPLRWSLRTNCSFLEINEVGGMVGGTPGEGDVGLFFMEVAVSDGLGGSDEVRYFLEVLPFDGEEVFGIKDLTPGLAYTGSGFGIRIRFNCCPGFDRVYLEYRFGGRDTATVEMGYYSLEFSTVIHVPIDSLDPLHYRMIGYRNGVYTSLTSVKTVRIIDDLLPAVQPIGDVTILKGSMLRVRVLADDNIGIGRIVWNGTPLPSQGDSIHGILEEIGVHHVTVEVYDTSENMNSISFTIYVVETLDEITDVGYYALGGVVFFTAIFLISGSVITVLEIRGWIGSSQGKKGPGR